MSRGRSCSSAHWTFAFLCASLFGAAGSAGARGPLGVYARVNVQDAIKGYNDGFARTSPWAASSPINMGSTTWEEMSGSGA